MASSHSIETLYPSKTSSRLTEDQVTNLLLSANISTRDFEFLVPKPVDRANKPPRGYLSVYKHQIQLGLRFPLHELVVEICNRMKVSPTQLWPLAHAKIVCFILCSKLHNVPAATADDFFNMFYPDRIHFDIFALEERPGINFLLLKNDFPADDEWMREFFFLKPVGGKSWNCLTKWRTKKCSYTSRIDDAALFQESVIDSGMLKRRFWIHQLVENKDLLVVGGIEPPGPQPPRFAFQYLMMHKMEETRFGPKDMPSAAASTPSTSKTLDLECVFEPEDCIEKLRKEKQQVSSELALMKVFVQAMKQENERNKAKIMDLELTKSSVEELKQENEQYKAKIVDSEHRTIQAKVKVKVLEERLENLKSESDCRRDSIIKHVIEEFKSSDEFANAVKEEAAKNNVKGFETCTQLVLNSGKLPSGFNFEFLDAADAERGSSSGQLNKTAADDPDRNYLKRKKT